MANDPGYELAPVLAKLDALDVGEAGPEPEVWSNVPELLTSNQTACEMVFPFAPVPVNVMLCQPAARPEGIWALPLSKPLL